MSFETSIKKLEEDVMQLTIKAAKGQTICKIQLALFAYFS